MGGGSSKQTSVTDTSQQQSQQESLASLVQRLQQQNSTQSQTGSQQGQSTSTGNTSQTGTALTQNNQTSTSLLPTEQQANVNTLLAGARDLYAQGPNQYYAGQTYASTDPLQTQARTMASQYATGVGSNLIGQYQQGEQTWLNPANIFNPANIPGFAAAQQGVTDQVNRNLTENILPSIRAGSIANNNFGGSAQGLSEALAAGRSSDALAQTLAKMNMDAYSQGLNMYNAAAARAPQSYGLGLSPATTLETVGGQNQADAQKAIDENVARYNYNQAAPAQSLAQLQALTGTAGQYGGTTTASATGQNSTQQSGSSDQTNQTSATNQSTTTIEDILQSLGLTASQGNTNASGTSHSNQTTTTQQSSSPLQMLGTLVSMASLFL